MKTLKYTRELGQRITNTENLPLGLRCKYLVTTKAHTGTLIAKQWKRKRPNTIGDNEVLVVFN